MPDELDLQAAGSYDFLFGEEAVLSDDDGAMVEDIAVADGVAPEGDALTADATFTADAALDPLAGEDTAPTGAAEPEPVALDAKEAARLALLAAKGDLDAAAKLQQFDPDLAFDLDAAPQQAAAPALSEGQEAALAVYDEGLALWATNAWDYQQWAEQNPKKNEAFVAMQAWREEQGLPKNATAAMIRDHALRLEMAAQTRQLQAQFDPVSTWREMRADEANTALTAADWTEIREAAKGKSGAAAVVAMRAKQAVLLDRRERAAANAPAVAKVAAAAQRAQRAQAAGARPAPQGGAGTGSPAMTFEQLEDLFLDAGQNGRMTPQLLAQYERADRLRRGANDSWSPV